LAKLSVALLGEISVTEHRVGNVWPEKVTVAGIEVDNRIGESGFIAFSFPSIRK
jgi:hypothetical protein